MDFKIDNDIYSGKLIDDIEEVKQMMMIRLIVERGSFIYDEALGSRLKLLLRQKPSTWESNAYIYIEEALKEEQDIKIIKIDVFRKNKTQLIINIVFTWNKLQDELEVII